MSNRSRDGFYTPESPKDLENTLQNHIFRHIGKSCFRSSRSLLLATPQPGGVGPASKGKTPQGVGSLRCSRPKLPSTPFGQSWSLQEAFLRLFGRLLAATKLIFEAKS